MDLVLDMLKSPFVWGLLLGLLVTGFVLYSGLASRRHARAEIKRLQTEMKELQGHLNTQLKINATGNASTQEALEQLKQQNENLRVNNALLQQKAGRAELRQLHLYESAVRAMREQAPGFAPAWEKALRDAETEMAAADGGLRKLVRSVFPRLASGAPASVPPSDQTDRTDV